MHLKLRKWEQVEMGNWRRLTAQKAWYKVYGIMRFAKHCTASQRQAIAQDAMRWSGRVGALAHYAAMIVNRSQMRG